MSRIFSEMKKYFLLFMFVLVFDSFGGQDTAIVSDGTEGPYYAGSDEFFIKEILKRGIDSLHQVAFEYTDDYTGLLLKRPVERGDTLVFKRTNITSEPDTSYSLHSMVSVKDSTPREEMAAVREGRKNGTETELSGYKSFGVSVDQMGGMNIEQGMDIRIFSRISSDAEISGHISDMETTLEGDTRELSEIDRIFLEFKKGDFRALAGDFTVETDNSILLESNKQVKGISLSLDKDEKRGSVFAAYSGSEHAQERIYGEAGYQGPYFLEGDGRQDFIQPVDGSVRVYSKGEELQEGKDYRVDYLQGAVTFSPGFVLEDDQLVTVDYEYGIYDYRRRAGGGSFHLSSPDSVIAVTGNVIAESDNKDNPLGLEMVIFQTTRTKELAEKLRPAQGTVRVVTTGAKGDSAPVYYRPPKSYLEPASLLRVLRQRLAG